MNLDHLSSAFQSQSIKSQSDLNKLVQICNSYGLNHEQTEQLINQFKKGAFYHSEQSFNDSLNNTLSQMTFSQKNDKQQYSFKQPPHQQFHKKSWENVSNPKMSSCHQSSKSCQIQEEQESVQRILHQKLMADKEVIFNLQEQNKKMRSSLEEKDSKIDDLLQMKRQDTQIILGLKDIIANLTHSIQQKDKDYKQLNQKYTHLMERKMKQLNSSKSYSQLDSQPLQDINNTFGQQSNNSNYVFGKSKNSQDHQPGESKTTNASSYFQGNGRVGKKSRIDIQKYKEMIENMRNNY